MIVTFTTSAYADITMFGEVAIRFLKTMGHSGTVPGAILAENVSMALENLKSALAPIENPSEREKTKDSVNLSTRALPLIELLTAAKKEKVDVMWS